MPPPLRALALLAAVVALGPAAHAQGIAPGTRVRVVSDDARLVGAVDRSTADSLVLALPGGGHAAVAWGDVGAVEQSLGRRGRPGRGALVGAGAMTALTLGTIVFGGSEHEVEDDLHDSILLLTLPVNAALGAGVGALVGLAWRTERWAALPVAAGPVPTGTGLSVAVRF